jgi:hypothetical protein
MNVSPERTGSYFAKPERRPAGWATSTVGVAMEQYTCDDEKVQPRFPSDLRVTFIVFPQHLSQEKKMNPRKRHYQLPVFDLRTLLNANLLILLVFCFYCYTLTHTFYTYHTTHTIVTSHTAGLFMVNCLEAMTARHVHILYYCSAHIDGVT